MTGLRTRKPTIATMGFEAHGSDDQPRDDNGRWSSGGGSFDLDKHKAAAADYRQSKGTNAEHNSALVAAAGIKAKGPVALKAQTEEAIAHVVESRILAQHLAGMTINVTELGKGYHGHSKGSSLEVSAESLRVHGPGFAATIVRHEMEHTLLTRQGIPSGQQESRVRYTAGTWARQVYSGLAKTNPVAGAGFKQAAFDQGVKW